MDELVKGIVEARGAWGGRDSIVPHAPPDLTDDYSARVLALLVERSGGRVELTRDDVRAVPARLLLVPYAMEDGLVLEVRQLAPSE